MSKKFYITHLYPKEMSIYGDMGNILAIQFRLKKYGFEPIYQSVVLGQKLPYSTDFYFLGGGQDKEQAIVFEDLLQKKERLLKDLNKGTPMLAICGGYQLLGQEFLTGENKNIPGLGFFPIKTKAPNSEITSRCVGNLIIKCNLPGFTKVYLVGFENHSGQTHFVNPIIYNSSNPLLDGNEQNHESNLGQQAFPLGEVLYGFGNNLEKNYEGCVYKNTIGTYLHGSCLPKNPELTDYFIMKSLELQIKDHRLTLQEFNQINKIKIDDRIALLTKDSIVKRFEKEFLKI
jgi:lipid II isoglutaminyl synthase (glutamine-hydrolysing)